MLKSVQELYELSDGELAAKTMQELKMIINTVQFLLSIFLLSDYVSKLYYSSIDNLT